EGSFPGALPVRAEEGGDDQRSYLGRPPGGDGRAGRLPVPGRVRRRIGGRLGRHRGPGRGPGRAAPRRAEPVPVPARPGRPAGPGGGGQLLGQLVRALPPGDAGPRAGQPGLRGGGQAGDRHRGGRLRRPRRGGQVPRRGGGDLPHRVRPAGLARRGGGELVGDGPAPDLVRGQGRQPRRPHRRGARGRRPALQGRRAAGRILSGVPRPPAGNDGSLAGLAGTALPEGVVAAANRVGWLPTSTWPPAVRRGGGGGCCGERAGRSWGWGASSSTSSSTSSSGPTP